MKIHDIPHTQLFVQKLFWLDRKPLPAITREPVNETEAPYRHGTARALRLPGLKTALIVGRWQGRRREKEALLAAMGGRVTQDNEYDINDLEHIA